MSGPQTKPDTSRLFSHPGLLAWLGHLPFVVPLGAALALAPAPVAWWYRALAILALLLASQALATNQSRRHMLATLAAQSPDLAISAGKPSCLRQGFVSQWLGYTVLGSVTFLPWLVPPLGGTERTLPALALLILLASFHLYRTRHRPCSSWWFRRWALVGSRLVSYEDVEMVVLVPWQGLDLRLRHQPQAIEVLLDPEEAQSLVARLKPVLTPLGIKIQTGA